jgi:hypothetical protein
MLGVVKISVTSASTCLVFASQLDKVWVLKSKQNSSLPQPPLSLFEPPRTKILSFSSSTVREAFHLGLGLNPY